MPTVSRANGERIWVVGARCGLGLALVDDRFEDGRFAGAFRFEGARPDGRDDERRDGEVFVAMRPQV
jgi:hypothetical protein